MFRLLTDVVFPLIAPTLLWLLWTAVRRPTPRAPMPWRGLLAAGLLLAILAVWGGWLHGETRDGLYHPARIGPNGQLIPGRIDQK